MRVKIVPVLSDNYAYLLVAKDGTTAAVDPVEPSKIISAAEREGLKVDCVLTTHHHWYCHSPCSNPFADDQPCYPVLLCCVSRGSDIAFVGAGIMLGATRRWQSGYQASE